MNEKNKKNFYMKNKKAYINGLLLVIFTAVLFFITIQKVETKRIDVKIGDEAPLEIRATKEIEDKNATEMLKNFLIEYENFREMNLYLFQKKQKL